MLALLSLLLPALAASPCEDARQMVAVGVPPRVIETILLDRERTVTEAEARCLEELGVSSRVLGRVSRAADLPESGGLPLELGSLEVAAGEIDLFSLSAARCRGLAEALQQRTRRCPQAPSTWSIELTVGVSTELAGRVFLPGAPDEGPWACTWQGLPELEEALVDAWLSCSLLSDQGEVRSLVPAVNEADLRPREDRALPPVAERRPWPTLSGEARGSLPEPEPPPGP